MESHSMSQVYNFNYQWSFKLADAFPLKKALDSWKDEQGRFFYEKEYKEEDWEVVGVPHTFNALDLFVARIEDAGSGQKRTFSFYSKWFSLSKEDAGKKVLIEFEGIRQTCYLYINGTLAGYYETGAGPFAFDLTPYINYESENLIAVATDNTSSRNLEFFGAETPNHPDAVPGTFITSLTSLEEIPEGERGVGYFWNCNDFNPSVGGLTKNIRLHIKPKVYITLPIYSNLRTKGVYIYGSQYDIENKTATIHCHGEIRNESDTEQTVVLESILYQTDGREAGRITSKPAVIPPVGEIPHLLTTVPENAYKKEGDAYIPVSEEEAGPTEIESVEVTEICANSHIGGLRFWSTDDPYLYKVQTNLIVNGVLYDSVIIETGFRKVSYDGFKGLMINDTPVWLTGYAQRSSGEWPAVGAVPDWLKDMEAGLVRESNGNHLRFMHIAAPPATIRSCDRYGIICTQPAGDKERENFGRQWNQRMELMRDIIIYFRNNPSIIFWEAGNNSINKEHMREMRLLKEKLDPSGGRYMGCRTINTEDVVCEAEYVGTMLNRHAARFQSEMMPVTETEYSREESPRRVWDDFSPPDYDYDNLWLGRGGRKQIGGDCHDLTAEDFALSTTKGYAEFFHDRMGGASGKNLYSATAALCWSDSAEHGRQAASENGRMSGRVDAARNKKQNFDAFRIIQSGKPEVKILGHWNYPPQNENNYKYPVKKFDGTHWIKTGEYQYRNPKEKTVYVLGSYFIARVELYINEKLAGVCDKPENTFVFPFEKIDITQSGVIEAIAYDYNGNVAAKDKIETAGTPSKLELTLHTAAKGLLADGVDIAYVDMKAVDEGGRLCPLSYDKISFTLEGEGVFLGGYNSGRYNGYGKEDSVIHKDHVYLECGYNRVFFRSTKRDGKITLTAQMEGLSPETIEYYSKAAPANALSLIEPPSLRPTLSEIPPKSSYPFDAIKEADECKYIPEDKVYCKVLLDGQEPDTGGILSVYDHGSVYSPILFILNRIKQARPHLFDYTYDSVNGILTITSQGTTVTAEKGRTHLLVNGEENLLNGEPYIYRDDVFIVEINAVISYIKDIKAHFDDKVKVFRIELPKE